MVYYFTSIVVSPPAAIYVGKDKFESLYIPSQRGNLADSSPDEELIKYGWEEDFHADNLSSAHVYLRLTPEQKWNELPPALIGDCAQLTKGNSIEGNKKDNVTVIYTPWSNLLKSSAMATGQVSFHDPKKTKTILISTRINAIINRLTKTRTIADTDNLALAKEAHLAELRKKEHATRKETQKEEERVKKERKEDKWKREHAYEEMYEEGEGGKSNTEGWDDDDFM